MKYPKAKIHIPTKVYAYSLTQVKKNQKIFNLLLIISRHNDLSDCLYILHFSTGHHI